MALTKINSYQFEDEYGTIYGLESPWDQPVDVQQLDPKAPRFRIKIPSYIADEYDPAEPGEYLLLTALRRISRWAPGLSEELEAGSVWRRREYTWGCTKDEINAVFLEFGLSNEEREQQWWFLNSVGCIEPQW